MELNIHQAPTRPRGFPDNSKRSCAEVSYLEFALKNSLPKVHYSSTLVTCVLLCNIEKHNVVLKCSLPVDCGLDEMENSVCGQMPQSSREAAERGDPAL